MHVLLCASLPFWEDDRKLRKTRVCNEPLDLDSNNFLKNISQSKRVIRLNTRYDYVSKQYLRKLRRLYNARNYDLTAMTMLQILSDDDDKFAMPCLITYLKLLLDSTDIFGLCGN